MLYGFASGTVACEATVSSRSLPLGTFRVRDERDSGEKVPGGESEERRLYSQATWSRDTDNFRVRFVPPVIFPQVSHITTEFYLNIL